MPRKKKKLLVAVLSSVMGALLLLGAAAAWLLQSASGRPRADRPLDILFDGSSWYWSGNPWQDKMPKRRGWRQIVQDSQFTLGEPQLTKVEYDRWTDWTLVLPDAKYPNIDGSTVMLPMAAEFARQHIGIKPEEASGFYNFSTTHYAYENLCNRTEKTYGFREYFEGVDWVQWETGRPVDIVLGTAPGEEELAIAAQRGVTFLQKPVCRDAFVFITGKNNPVDSLTLEQVRGIFSGEITNWKDVGGRDEAIQAYQREPGSGSQTGMEQLVMQGIPMANPEMVSIIAGMGELVDAVAEYKNSAASIGYSYRYYIDNQYGSVNLKQLKIEGIAPTDENIRNNGYPLSVNYVGAIRAGEEDAPGGLFLDWILSEEGQACVAQAGYVPMHN
ncbi:MAG: substrate-binding domain-containing protein [Oscillospiraceae bacterium]|nr:substrate-binding domain-containing protein [Oscillospiraceae bacterium]